MALLDSERTVIENILKRLDYKTNDRCSQNITDHLEGASVYIDTWIAAPLRLLLEADNETKGGNRHAAGYKRRLAVDVSY